MSRGAAYIRTSQESSPEDRQRATITTWLGKTGRELDQGAWYLDLGWKRHQANVRPAFNKLLKLAKAGSISWIVVEEATRFGTKDAYEFTRIMGDLVDWGVEVWEARSDRLLNPPSTSMGDYLLATVGALHSTQEVTNLATRSLKAKLLKAELGAWPGGSIPFGMAVQARNGAGVILWTVEEVGAKYEQTYPGGQVKYLDYFPKDRETRLGELLYLLPSRFPERTAAVQLVSPLTTLAMNSTDRLC